ncbi:MAG: glutaminyl-peptide cyclotransferase [Oscillochloris sp.]|nr:glutaminyl-peptide cyclotransferase [Oscillochloris sp.]
MFHRWGQFGLCLALLALTFGCTPAQSASISQALPTARAITPRPLTTATPVATTAPTVPAPAQAAPAPVLGYRVVGEYPHDSGAWTQGLVYLAPDRFYEGTGDWANSRLREIGLDGAVYREVELNSVATPVGSQPLYGEGIAVVGDQIFQITWQSGRGFIYNRNSFELEGEFRYPADGMALPQEGWGLTYDGNRLIMSDGTANLYFVDPAATAATGVLAVTAQVQVQDAGTPVIRLNELEYIDGTVYANVWLTNWIVQIDPASGDVLARIDLSGLLTPAEQSNADVLNGIAYDGANDRLFVTGKHWPKLFEIDLTEPQALFMPILGAG